MTLGEAAGEAAPQAIIQMYSMLIGVIKPEGQMLGVNQAHILRASISVGLLSLANSLVDFDFYGESDVPATTKLNRGFFRLSEVSLRMTSIAYFGALLRPEQAGTHENVAFHLPLVLLCGLFANIFLLRKFAPKVTELQLLWSLLVMVASPPKF